MQLFPSRKHNILAHLELSRALRDDAHKQNSELTELSLLRKQARTWYEGTDGCISLLAQIHSNLNRYARVDEDRLVSFLDDAMQRHDRALRILAAVELWEQWAKLDPANPKRIEFAAHCMLAKEQINLILADLMNMWDTLSADLLRQRTLAAQKRSDAA